MSLAGKHIPNFNNNISQSAYYSLFLSTIPILWVYLLILKYLQGIAMK